MYLPCKSFRSSSPGRHGLTTMMSTILSRRKRNVNGGYRRTAVIAMPPPTPFEWSGTSGWFMKPLLPSLIIIKLDAHRLACHPHNIDVSHPEFLLSPDTTIDNIDTRRSVRLQSTQISFIKVQYQKITYNGKTTISENIARYQSRRSR